MRHGRLRSNTRTDDAEGTTDTDENLRPYLNGTLETRSNLGIRKAHQLGRIGNGTISSHHKSKTAIDYNGKKVDR